jgi:nucleotide-binding universal stress UspA family protein
MTAIHSVAAPANMNDQPAVPRHLATSELRKILVPTDLKNGGKVALQYAVSLAQAFGAKLTLLHVYQEPYSCDYLRGPHACEAIFRHRREAENALAALAMEVSENRVTCNADFRYGSLCGEIAKAAENCDLMVISTHRYGWLDRFAYGSDADSILRNSPCPVLIIPQD